MTRVVVYGEYPPTPGPAAEATLAAVRARLAEGVEVEVVSPWPSAAHHDADLGSIRGAARLARLAAGADLDLTLDPALLAEVGGRGAPAQGLLAAAVAGARHSTVRLGPLAGPAGRGRVRLVLGRADEVVAASEDDAAALERAGIPRARLSVQGGSANGRAGLAGTVDRPGAGAPGGSESAGGHAAGSPGGTGAAEPSDGTAGPGAPSDGARLGAARPPWGLSDAPGREELEAAVRRRAAEDRASTAGNSSASTWPLHLLGPFSPPSPASGKPLFAVVKKVMWRLVAWVVLPMAEHVNHLQQATIESIDRHSALPDHRGDRQVTIS